MCKGTEAGINMSYSVTNWLGYSKRLIDLVRENAQLPGSLKPQDPKFKACKFKACSSNLSQNKK